MKPAKWIVYSHSSGRPRELNPAYVKYLESFAKRAAEGVLLFWIDAMEWQCNFCHRAGMPREKIGWECEHAPDCIVLAAQEYLKDNE